MCRSFFWPEQGAPGEEGTMGKAAWTRGNGPLVCFADGFRHELLGCGYSPGVVKSHVLLMGQLDRWLAGESLIAADLTVGRAEEFLATLRAGGQRRVPTLRTLGLLLDYLRDRDVLAPEEPGLPTPRGELLARYRQHLLDDRGLSTLTVLRYERMARRFLAGRAEQTGGPLGIEGLDAAEVNATLLECCSRLVPESAKREAADLRALLRFLYLEGLTGVDLGSAMPPVAARGGGPGLWRACPSPRSLPW